MKKIFSIIGIFVAGSMLVSCALLPKEEEFQEAPIVKEYDGKGFGKTSVLRGDLINAEELEGRYRGTATYKLEATGDEKIKKIMVKVGDKVLNGDTLVRYYIESYEQKLEEAELNIKKINLQIKQQEELKKLEVNKQKKIGAGSQAIKLVKEQYDSTIDSFKTQLKLLQLEVNEAEEGIEESDALSELDGTVTKIMKNAENSSPAEGDELVVVEGKKKNRFEISSKLAEKYKEGDKVTIEVKGEEYEAVVAKPSGNKKKLYLYPVSKNLKFEEDDKCTLQYVIEQRQSVLYLPSATVFEMGDKHVVYVENKEGLKVMKEVEVGVTINHLTEIVSGLNEGDQVITD